MRCEPSWTLIGCLEWLRRYPSTAIILLSNIASLRSCLSFHASPAVGQEASTAYVAWMWLSFGLCGCALCSSSGVERSYFTWGIHNVQHRSSVGSKGPRGENRMMKVIRRYWFFSTLIKRKGVLPSKGCDTSLLTWSTLSHSEIKAGYLTGRHAETPCPCTGADHRLLASVRTLVVHD